MLTEQAQIETYKQMAEYWQREVIRLSVELELLKRVAIENDLLKHYCRAVDILNAEADARWPR